MWRSLFNNTLKKYCMYNRLCEKDLAAEVFSALLADAWMKCYHYLISRSADCSSKLWNRCGHIVQEADSKIVTLWQAKTSPFEGSLGETLEPRQVLPAERLHLAALRRGHVFPRVMLALAFSAWLCAFSLAFFFYLMRVTFSTFRIPENEAAAPPTFIIAYWKLTRGAVVVVVVVFGRSEPQVQRLLIKGS